METSGVRTLVNVFLESGSAYLPYVYRPQKPEPENRGCAIWEELTNFHKLCSDFCMDAMLHAHVRKQTLKKTCRKKSLSKYKDK